MNEIFSIIDNTLSTIDQNVYTKTAFRLFPLMYAALAAPKLPLFIAQLFEYTIFKIFILVLVLITGKHDPVIALMMATAFVISMNTLSEYKILDKFNLIGKTNDTDTEETETTEPDVTDEIIDNNIEEENKIPGPISASPDVVYY